MALTDTNQLNARVREIVALLMLRPITEAIAMQVRAVPGFEYLEIVNGQWVGFDGDERVGGEEHGWLEALIITMLMNWALTHKSGRVYSGDTDFVLDGAPGDIRLLRRPDVAYLRASRIKPTPGAVFAAPDLAVEIISPSDRPAAIRQKLGEYLQHGTSQVWQVYPETREIVVHRADNTAITYRPGDTLPGGDLLPGFVLDIAAIFAQ